MTDQEWNARMAQHCRDEAARLRSIMGDDYPPAADIERKAEEWEAKARREMFRDFGWSVTD